MNCIAIVDKSVLDNAKKAAKDFEDKHNCFAEISIKEKTEWDEV